MANPVQLPFYAPVILRFPPGQSGNPAGRQSSLEVRSPSLFSLADEGGSEEAPFVDRVLQDFFIGRASLQNQQQISPPMSAKRDYGVIE
jgi:hypothetical protein